MALCPSCDRRRGRTTTPRSCARKGIGREGGRPGVAPGLSKPNPNKDYARIFVTSDFAYQVKDGGFTPLFGCQRTDVSPLSCSTKAWESTSTYRRV